MIFIQLCAALLGLIALLLTVLVTSEVFNSIEFRKHQQSAGPMGGMRLVEMMGHHPEMTEGPKEEEKPEGEENKKEDDGRYL